MSTEAEAPSDPHTLRIDDGYVDLARHAVVRSGVRTALSTREAELLAYLARAGDLVTRDELLTEVWHHRSSHPSRAVDMCVRRLRAKIERDPAAPVHVITVLGEGYRFVPPRSLGLATEKPVPPPPLTAFFGRADALAEVRAALDASRLVTLLGGPGLGKTRLARELCRDWPGRSAFCDLTSAVDAEGLVAGAARVLGAFPGTHPEDSVGAALAAGPILLVLDNFEQLTAAAPVVARWLAQAPEARILVTSRARLAVAGERLVTLPPLDPAAARSLFVDRAAAVGVTGLDPEAVARVVVRLECVPLAIELAAGRLRTLSLSQLFERLDSHLRALVSPASDRQGTMRAAVTWSWDLLALPEQAMLAALSVFRGAFELEAVEEVVGAGEPHWPDELLEGLVDRSLVRVEITGGSRRFALFESVRELAAERLGEDRPLRRRHLHYYAGAAEQMLARLPLAEALRRLEDLRPELMSAWERASDADDRGRVAIVLGDLLARRGPRASFVRIVEQTLATPMSAERTARLLVIAGQYSVFARNFDDARHRLALAEPLLVGASPAALGDACDLRARLLAFDGDLDAAAGALRASRGHFYAAGIHGRGAWAALHLALLPERARTPETDADRKAVEALLDQAEWALRHVDDDLGLRLVDACRARWALSAGERAAAVYWLDRADWSARPISSDSPGTLESAVVAVVEEALGRYDRALAASRHRAEARRAYAPPDRQASAQMRVVQFLALLGRTDEAIALARASMLLAPSSALRVPLAAALLESGDPAGALAELGRGTPWPDGRLWAALALLELGRPAPDLEEVAIDLEARHEVVLAPLARLALAVARSEPVRFEDPDDAPALRRYVDRRASAGRAAADLVTRSLRRVLESRIAPRPAAR